MPGYVSMSIGLPSAILAWKLTECRRRSRSPVLVLQKAIPASLVGDSEHLPKTFLCQRANCESFSYSERLTNSPPSLRT